VDRRSSTLRIGNRPQTARRLRVGAAAAHAARDRFYRWANGVGVAELSRLAAPCGVGGRDPGLPLDQGCSNGPTEAVNLLTGKVKRIGTAFATSSSTAAPAPVLRRQVADSPDRKTARPPSTLGGVEPVKHGKRSPSGTQPGERAADSELTSVSAGQRRDSERDSVSAGQTLVGGRDRV
jgi:hypothetical protein